MKKIEDKNTLIKYLNYLISFADQLLEKYDLNSADLNQLKKENEVLQVRISSSDYISHKLKDEIANLKIKGSVPENKINFLKTLFQNRSRIDGTSFEENAKYAVEKYREQIINYKQRVSNLVLTLDNYTFYK